MGSGGRELGRSISRVRLARKLDALIAWRGPPRLIVSDNGPEMTSQAMLRWANRCDSLCHARRLLAIWQQDYNHVRPHSAHGGLPPAAAGERLRNPGQLRHSPAPVAAHDRL